MVKNLIINFFSRDMEQTFTKKMNTMKGNGIMGREVAGVACIMKMGQSMKGNGSMDADMEMECSD